jgi:hypothetical protein
MPTTKQPARRLTDYAVYLAAGEIAREVFGYTPLAWRLANREACHEFTDEAVRRIEAEQGVKLGKRQWTTVWLQFRVPWERDD